jgi:flagellar motor component MotA
MPSGCSRGIAKERSPSGTLERITGYLKQEVLGRLCSEGFLEHSEDENNALAGVFGGSKFSKTRYMEIMKILYELFTRTRKEGPVGLKTDSDNPEQSPKYPKLLKDHHVMNFICDTIRMAAGGGVEPFDVDQSMDLDMEVHHHEAGAPVTTRSTTADSLNRLGS